MLAVGMLILPDICWLPDLMGIGMEMIFYSWLTPVPDLNRDGYEMSIFFHPRVTRRVPDTLLPL
jgi:hypothetical protein